MRTITRIAGHYIRCASHQHRGKGIVPAAARGHTVSTRRNRGDVLYSKLAAPSHGCLQVSSVEAKSYVCGLMVASGPLAADSSGWEYSMSFQ